MHIWSQENPYSKPTKKSFEKEHAASPSRAVWAASYLESFWLVNNKLSQQMLIFHFNFYGVLDLVTLSGISYERSIKKTSTEGQFHFNLHKQQQIASTPVSWPQVCYWINDNKTQKK